LVRVSFCIFALCKNNLCWQFDLAGMNGHAILPPLNSRADCVSYSPVLHQIKFALNWGPDKTNKAPAVKLEAEEDWGR
jgi:hypothetical protein